MGFAGFVSIGSCVRFYLTKMENFKSKQDFIQHIIGILEHSMLNKLHELINYNNYKEVLFALNDASEDYPFNRNWLIDKLKKTKYNLEFPEGIIKITDEENEVLKIIQEDLKNNTLKFYIDSKNLMRVLNFLEIWELLKFLSKSGINSISAYLETIRKSEVERYVQTINKVRNLQSESHNARSFEMPEISNERVISYIEQCIGLTISLGLVDSQHKIKSYLENRKAFQILNSINEIEIENIEHNLPKPDFENWGWVDRSEKIKELDELIMAYPTVCIQAEGGYGKSALVLKYLNDYVKNNNDNILGRRFDRIIWISSKNEILIEEQKTMIKHSYKDDYNSFINALFVAVYGSPTDGDDIESFVLDFIEKEHKVLFVIDNLETISTEKVHSFIKNEILKDRHISGNQVLITSRSPLDEFKTAPLGKFTERQTFELFKKVCVYQNLTIDFGSCREDLALTQNTPLATIYFVQLIKKIGYKQAVQKLRSHPQELLSFLFGELYKELERPSKYILWIASTLENSIQSSVDTELIKHVYIKVFSTKEKNKITDEEFEIYLRQLRNSSFLEFYHTKYSTNVSMPAFIYQFIYTNVENKVDIDGNTSKQFHQIRSELTMILRDSNYFTDDTSNKLSLYQRAIINGEKKLYNNYFGVKNSQKKDVIQKFESLYGESEISVYLSAHYSTNILSSVSKSEILILIEKSISKSTPFSSFIDNYILLLKNYDFRYLNRDNFISILNEINEKLSRTQNEKISIDNKKILCKIIENMVFQEFELKPTYIEILEKIGGINDANARKVIALITIVNCSNVNRANEFTVKKYIDELLMNMTKTNLIDGFEIERFIYSTISLFYSIIDNKDESIEYLKKSLQKPKFQSKKSSKFHWIIQTEFSELIVQCTYSEEFKYRKKDILKNADKLYREIPQDMKSRYTKYKEIINNLADN
jgi:hypothetical protein